MKRGQLERRTPVRHDAGSAQACRTPVGARTSVRPARWQHVGRGGI